MKIRKSLIFVLLLALASVCQGEGKDTTGFDFMIVPTGLDQEMDVWYKTPPDSTPHISSVSEVTKGQKCHFALFFSRYQLDKDGNANITFDVRIKTPDGSLYFENKYEHGDLSANEKKLLGYILSKAFEKDKGKENSAKSPR